MKLERITLHTPEQQAILGALPPDVVRRMRNWVDWKQGSSVSCASRWAMEYGAVRIGGAYGAGGGFRESHMPILVAEAEQTQGALLAIPDEYGQAIALFWLGGEDLSFRSMALTLGCTHPTVKARLLRGHTLLVAEIYRRQCQAVYASGHLLATAS